MADTTSFSFSGAMAPNARAAALAALFLAASPMEHADADVVLAKDHIRAGVILKPEHLMIAKGDPRPGEAGLMAEVVGLQARATLYKGRPIRSDLLGPPIVIRRNSFVSLEFRRNGLVLRSEGRSLDEGAIGQRVRVMNLDSKKTIFGTVVGPSKVIVQ